MSIYIALLINMCVVALYYNANSYSYEKKERGILKVIFIMLFFLCALRLYTVGRDVGPYRLHYLDVLNHDLLDFNYIYFEKGYILLMKVCAKIGLSWQQYLGVIYVIILFPIYLFIKKYSKNTFMSAWVFVCYMYFEFNLTGIRQAIAASICLLAFITLLESKRYPLVKYILIVTVAVMIHKSAFAAYFIIPFLFIRSIKTTACIISLGTLGSLAIRNRILNYIKVLFVKDSLNAESSLYFGGNLVFLLVLGVLFILVDSRGLKSLTYDDTGLEDNYEIIQEELTIGRLNEQGKALNYDYEDVFTKSFLLSIFFMVIFGMANSARSYMILNQVIFVLLPNSFEYFEGNSRRMCYIGCFVFMLWFFVVNTLIPNNFDIVPYQFFWQQEGFY